MAGYGARFHLALGKCMDRLLGETAYPLTPGLTADFLLESDAVSDQDRKVVMSVAQGRLDDLPVVTQALETILFHCRLVARGGPPAHRVGNSRKRLGGRPSVI